MQKFKSLQIGNNDTVGARFNGQDLHKDLVRRGYPSRHLVWEKHGKDPLTSDMHFPLQRTLTNAIRGVEHQLSVHSMLHPAPLLVARRPEFKNADLVHYHLLHTGWFSIKGLPHLTKQKPSLLTLHDPWWLTGHCIYPRGCDRYLKGCGSCPDLDVMWSMKKDNTAAMWQHKKEILANSDLEMIVASKYMLNLVQSSPITAHLKHHLVPFGVDLENFRPGAGQEERKRLGIQPDSTVICLRATISEFKGLSYIIEALDKLDTDKPLTIITFEYKNLLIKYLGKHQLIDLGWVEDPKIVADAYRAADIFLMPSTAEAFGVMAVEAMASGKPIVVFDGTSLPEVVFAPQGGVCVPPNADALGAALKDLMDNPQKRLQLGEQARQLAEQHYDWDDHVEKMIALYDDFLQRKQNRPSASRSLSCASR